MASSRPIQIQVADIIQWYDRGELIINDTFQRHAVWVPSAKTYLIDTILNDLPIPKIYFRTQIDAKTQSSVREIVDGQQRIRAIHEFAKNEIRLTSRSKEFKGLRYRDLPEDLQERFLGYTLTAEQLLNASDDDVIDIFARLNSYTVPLNAAEKRHAAFQTDFKFAVREASQKWRPFIERFNVFTTQQRFRMNDDTFFAEMYGLVLDGVTDGGDANLKKLYEKWDDDAFTSAVQKRVESRVGAALCFLENEIPDAIRGRFARPYHLLMLSAAYLHHKYGIPDGSIERLPSRAELAGSETVIKRLAKLEEAFEEDPIPGAFQAFVEASEGATTRIATREVRFREFVRILRK